LWVWMFVGRPNEKMALGRAVGSVIFLMARQPYLARTSLLSKLRDHTQTRHTR